MADSPMQEQPSRDPGASREPPYDLPAEAERAHTPRTPLLALTGVWLTVVAVVVVVLAAVALTLYFV